MDHIWGGWRKILGWCVLSTFPQMLGNPTWGVRLACQILYLLSHLTNPGEASGKAFLTYRTAWELTGFKTDS